MRVLRHLTRRCTGALLSSHPVSLIVRVRPFTAQGDCSLREPYMDNGMRTMQRALVVSNHRGLKPAKKRAAVAPPPGGDRAKPANYPAARNLLLKRRKEPGVPGGGL